MNAKQQRLINETKQNCLISLADTPLLQALPIEFHTGLRELLILSSPLYIEDEVLRDVALNAYREVHRFWDERQAAPRLAQAQGRALFMSTCSTDEKKQLSEQFQACAGGGPQ